MKHLWKRRIAILGAIVMVFVLACSAKLIPWSDLAAYAAPEYATVGTASLSDTGDTVFIRAAQFNIGTEEEPVKIICSGFTVGNIGSADDPTANVDLDVLTPIYPGAPLKGTLDKNIYICGSITADLYVDGLTLGKGHTITAAGGGFDVKMGKLTVDAINASGVPVSIGDKAEVTVNGNASVGQLMLYEPSRHVRQGQIDPATYNPDYLPGKLHVKGDLSGPGSIYISGGGELKADGDVSNFKNGYYGIAIASGSKMTVGGKISDSGGIGISNVSELDVTGSVSAIYLQAVTGSSVNTRGSFECSGLIYIGESSLTVGGSLKGGDINFRQVKAPVTVGGSMNGGSLLISGTESQTTSLTVNGAVTLTGSLDIYDNASVTAKGALSCNNLSMEGSGTKTLTAESLKTDSSFSIQKNATVDIAGDCSVGGSGYPLLNVQRGSQFKVGGDLTANCYVDLVEDSSLTVTGNMTVGGGGSYYAVTHAGCSISCGGDLTCGGHVGALNGSEISVTGKLSAGKEGVYALGKGASIEAASISSTSIHCYGNTASVTATGDIALSNFAYTFQNDSISAGGDLSCRTFHTHGGSINVGGSMTTALTYESLDSGILTVGKDFISTGTQLFSTYNSNGLAVLSGKLTVGGNVEFGELLLNSKGDMSLLDVAGKINANRITDLNTVDENENVLILHTIEPFRSAASNSSGYINYIQPYDQQYIMLADEEEKNYYAADISDLTKTVYDVFPATPISISLVPGEKAEWADGEPCMPVGYSGMSLTLPTADDLKFSSEYCVLTGWATEDGETVCDPGAVLTLNEDITLYAQITEELPEKEPQEISFDKQTVIKTVGDKDFTNEAKGAMTAVTYEVTEGSKVASVDETTGKVHILKAGTATITATAAEDDTYASATASYTLKVERDTSDDDTSSPVENNVPPADQKPKADPLSDFTDLDPEAWYNEGIGYCVENGIMEGVGNGRFNPNGTTSRAMIVTILYRMEKEPEVTGENPFDDVPAGTWYTDAVIWAAENKIVEGYGNGKFGPSDDITREQLATILYRYAQTKGKGFTGAWMFLLNFPDAAEVSDWADEAMHWMVMNGVIQGKSGKLVPQGGASRAEAATMIQRFCTLDE